MDVVTLAGNLRASPSRHSRMVMGASGLPVGTQPPVRMKTLGEWVAKGKAAPLTFSSGSDVRTRCAGQPINQAV